MLSQQKHISFVCQLIPYSTALLTFKFEIGEKLRPFLRDATFIVKQIYMGLNRRTSKPVWLAYCIFSFEGRRIVQVE